MSMVPKPNGTGRIDKDRFKSDGGASSSPSVFHWISEIVLVIAIVMRSTFLSSWMMLWLLE